MSSSDAQDADEVVATPAGSAAGAVRDRRRRARGGEAAATSSSCDRRRRSGAGRSLLPPRGMRRDGAVADATDGVRRDRVAEPLPRSKSGRSFVMDFLLVRTSAISAFSCRFSFRTWSSISRIVSASISSTMAADAAM